METIKIEGYSEGDKNVGIPYVEFEIDTGLEEIDKEKKEYIVKTLIRDIWELHDNGDLLFSFSDEEIDDDWGYNRRFTWEDSKRILEEEKNGK